MPENVVYILGAGFSRGLGLPIMSDFIEKAQELYNADKEHLSHFKSVLDFIKSASFAKNYYDLDLTNIEELYSIIEMEKYVSDSPSTSDYTRFIIDVIKRMTPPLIPNDKALSREWENEFLGNSEQWKNYGYFVLNLLSLEAKEIQKGAVIEGISFSKAESISANYTIISLNYDMIMESILTFIGDAAFHRINDYYYFVRKPSLSISLNIAKIHGSISDGEIIPPSWNKGLRSHNSKNAWKMAYSALENANHIRILGYSLPETDAYIKYLLKFSIIKTEFLKTLDVICLDADGSVKQRYEKFITTKKLRFKSSPIESYLKTIFLQSLSSKFRTNGGISLNMLEEAHNEFFRGYRS